jgi:beta-glucosidase/6-phospho-beta-glucosidase/beta-galactosidase
VAAIRFGVATADHQCEAYDGHDDIRDVWERVRGLTARGQATDFWNRYREDVDLAKGLGCSAFRLSLSWARLEPDAGRWDDAAFAHYREILQYMRDAGMTTVVTLHHNTWPLHVQAAGNGAGMLDRAFPERVAAYAREVATRVGDLIDYYVTINEPNQLVYGYIKGFWMRAYPMPPGLQPFATSEQQMDAVLILIPNLFRAHARAREEIRKLHPDAKCGTNPLILGLPRWLQRLVDRNATRLKSPEDARRQAALLSQRAFLDRGTVDISIAQIAMNQERMEHVLFSEPYYTGHANGNEEHYAVAIPLGSRALLNAVDQGIREYKKSHPQLTQRYNRKTIAHIGRSEGTGGTTQRVPDLDASLRNIRRRGVLVVGIHPGVEGLCVRDADGGYSGLEPELARAIARVILGSDGKVRFVPLQGERRVTATRSPLRIFDGLRKSFALYGTLVGTNWWNLGMAGRLPPFLCPSECVGTLDYVGLDYYWGVPSFWPGQIRRLFAAAEFRYGMAPVWPNFLDEVLLEAQADFPGKPIIVIENGCVTNADGFSRARYIEAHVRQVERALDKGAPIFAYLCWSITSNREWGLPFDDNSDFGLYHIELDKDPALKRMPTEASAKYAEIIKAHTEQKS